MEQSLHAHNSKPYLLACRQRIVAQSTGCDSQLLFEEIYDYYARAEAWYVAPGAHVALQRLRDSGNSHTMRLMHITKCASLY